MPPPEGQRFRGFRTEFGRAVRDSGMGSFAVALKKYARDATGGKSIGPRRLGTAYVAGGALVALLSELQQGGTGEASVGVDLSSVVGKPVGEAIEGIAQVLAPQNADADLIRIAVQEALGEVVPELDIFEPTQLKTDDFISVLVEFFSRVLFLLITEDAGDSWNKAPNDLRLIQAENELFDIIRAAVDNHLSPTLSGDMQGLTRTQIESLERRAMNDVWSEWEGYE